LRDVAARTSRQGGNTYGHAFRFFRTMPMPFAVFLFDPLRIRVSRDKLRTVPQLGMGWRRPQGRVLSKRVAGGERDSPGWR